jgi:hypothetical protein
VEEQPPKELVDQVRACPARRERSRGGVHRRHAIQPDGLSIGVVCPNLGILAIRHDDCLHLRPTSVNGTQFQQQLALVPCCARSVPLQGHEVVKDGPLVIAHVLCHPACG